MRRNGREYFRFVNLRRVRRKDASPTIATPVVVASGLLTQMDSIRPASPQAAVAEAQRHIDSSAVALRNAAMMLAPLVVSLKRADAKSGAKQLTSLAAGLSVSAERRDALHRSAADTLAAVAHLPSLPGVQRTRRDAETVVRATELLRLADTGAPEDSAVSAALRAPLAVHAAAPPSATSRASGSTARTRAQGSAMPSMESVLRPDLVAESVAEAKPVQLFSQTIHRLVPYAGSVVVTSLNTAAHGGPDGRVPVTVGFARVLGIGDLLLTRERLVGYEYGEISHVENVLASEHRNREHRITTRESESTSSTSSDSSTERTELTTTERYELQEAASAVVTSTRTTSVGVSVSGSYGFVSAGADFGYSSGNTQQNSTSSATTTARDVTDAAVREVETAVRERHTARSATQITERNVHGFDNASGTRHIVGIYRFLDKVLEAQLYNYGARLMLEFVVPEPAAHLVHALTHGAPTGVALEEPPSFTESSDDITVDNYRTLAARYGTGEVEPPPPVEIVEPTSIVIPPADSMDFPTPPDNKTSDPDATDPSVAWTADSTLMAVPEGYEVTSVQLQAVFGKAPSAYQLESTLVEVAVGSRLVNLAYVSAPGAPTMSEARVDFDTPIVGTIPLAWAASTRRGAAITITLRCNRLEHAMDAWRLRTWSAIRAAYDAARRSYDSQLSYIRSYGSGGITNPSVMRATEMTELKRGVLELLTDQGFSTFGALDFPTDGFPILTGSEARLEGEYIRFFEDAVEWENITYQFYPYPWAGRHRWLELLNRDNADLVHREFLRAGAARVIVPVSPSFEAAVLDYLDTGAIWSQDEPITLPPDHPWADAIAELEKAPRNLEEVPVDAPWEVRVPTSLVLLQQGGDPNTVKLPS
jgi:hypothetical protein